MNRARDAAEKWLALSVAAAGHAGWWLRWQTDRHACREVARLRPLPTRAAGAERRAA
jgi:hypothetical protein